MADDKKEPEHAANTLPIQPESTPAQPLREPLRDKLINHGAGKTKTSKTLKK